MSKPIHSLPHSESKNVADYAYTTLLQKNNIEFFVYNNYSGNSRKINFLSLNLLIEYINKKSKIGKCSQNFFRIFNFYSMRKIF